jgi:hypothetical protein
MNMAKVNSQRSNLQEQNLPGGAELPITDEPFAAVILATADSAKVDKRTRSNWSRLLRYAAEYKPSSEPLAAFIHSRVVISDAGPNYLP